MCNGASRTYIWRMALSFHDLSRVFALAALTTASIGCVTHECTLRGCTDGLGIEFRTPTGAWTNGVYELAVHIDGQLAGSCTLRVPEQLPDPPGKVFPMPCGTNIEFNISSQSACENGCDGNACWQKCTPIPGKYESRLAVRGTPARIGLALVRDGETILAEDVEPAYAEVYPNGPECGGACRQATLEYTVP
jgi:hypothetical protein